MCEYLDNVCAIHVQQWKLDHTFWTEYCQARNLGRPVRIRTKYFSEYNWQTMTHAYSISVFGSTVSLVMPWFGLWINCTSVGITIHDFYGFRLDHTPNNFVIQPLSLSVIP